MSKGKVQIVSGFARAMLNAETRRIVEAFELLVNLDEDQMVELRLYGKLDANGSPTAALVLTRYDVVTFEVDIAGKSPLDALVQAALEAPKYGRFPAWKGEKKA